ncbi:MAG: Serine/Threonine protein kinases, catalytic domain [Paramarteilia canceri]
MGMNLNGLRKTNSDLNIKYAPDMIASKNSDSKREFRELTRLLNLTQNIQRTCNEDYLRRSASFQVVPRACVSNTMNRVGNEQKVFSNTYKVIKCVGKGTFGRVLECIRQNDQFFSTTEGIVKLPTIQKVALKVLRSCTSYSKQGQAEINILKYVKATGGDRFNLIQIYDYFLYQNRALCIVFELLDINLYQVLKNRVFKPLPLRSIRVILNQVLVGLAHLHHIGLIHSDLKPENIMCVDHINRPNAVKIIDLGSACFSTDSKNLTYMQSRYYRSPEILLNLSFDYKIDIWSLGCIAVEMFLGWPIYPGCSEYDQLMFIDQTQGPLPNAMVEGSYKAVNHFFESRDGYYRLKDIKYVEESIGKAIGTKETRKYILKNLKSLYLFVTKDSLNPKLDESETEMAAETRDRLDFVQMVCSLLTVDPYHRATAIEALNTNFIRMLGIESNYSYVNTDYYSLSRNTEDSVSKYSTLGDLRSTTKRQMLCNSISSDFVPEIKRNQLSTSSILPDDRLDVNAGLNSEASPENLSQPEYSLTYSDSYTTTNLSTQNKTNYSNYSFCNSWTNRIPANNCSFSINANNSVSSSSSSSLYSPFFAANSACSSDNGMNLYDFVENGNYCSS